MPTRRADDRGLLASRRDDPRRARLSLDDHFTGENARALVSDADGMDTLEAQVGEWSEFAELADAMGADIRVVVVRIVGTPTPGGVVVFFGQAEFPDVLFGYRCMPPGTDRHEKVWLGEALATGELHRLMRRAHVAPDAEGVVWVRLRGSTLVAATVA